MVALKDFIGKVLEIAGESPSYLSGGDSRNGRCDCIGLIIGAIRRAGGEWRGTHGSNYAARNEMEGLREISGPDDLRVGEAVYKYRSPGEPRYNLPPAYRDHDDLRDYYHVGVVVSVHPLKIYHCTTWDGGSGVRVDTALGKWRVAGKLKKIDDRTEGDAMSETPLWVYASNGKPVNLRAAPNTKSATRIIERVPVWTRVTQIEQDGGWTKIRTPVGNIGWMMSVYLQEHDGQDQPDNVTVTISREAARYLLEALKGGLNDV